MAMLCYKGVRGPSPRYKYTTVLRNRKPHYGLECSTSMLHKTKFVQTVVIKTMHYT